MKKNKREDLEFSIEYEDILKRFYENIYGDDIKELPLTAGQYIIANRTELGLIYQKLALIEERFEEIKNKIIEDAKKEADNIIQDAKLKTFAILDNNIKTEDDELEIIRTVKDLASENLVYLYKQMREETQKNIETLISIEKTMQSNLKELEIYKNVKKMKQIY